MDSVIDLAIGLEAVNKSYTKSFEKVRELSKQFEAPVRNKTGYHELAAASQQFETSSISLGEQIKKQPKMFRERLQANGMAAADIEKVMIDFNKGYSKSIAIGLDVHKHNQSVADTVQRLCKQVLSQWDAWEVKDGRMVFADAAQGVIYEKDLAQLQEMFKLQESAQKRWEANMPK